MVIARPVWEGLSPGGIGVASDVAGTFLLCMPSFGSINLILFYFFFAFRCSAPNLPFKRA